MDLPELVNQLHLDRNDPVPLYHQLERQLCTMIEQGVLKPGDKIPGDIPLSDALKLNSRTVRQALARMVDRGLLQRVRRAGTFVTQGSPLRDTVGFFYFHEAVASMSLYAEAMQRYLARHGADLKIVSFPKDFFERTDLLQEVRRMGLKGAIITPLRGEACLNNLLSLERASFPYVRMSNPYHTGLLRAPLVKADAGRVIRHGLEYLWAYGHRRIGMFFDGRPEIDAVWTEFAGEHGGMPERWKMRLDHDGTLEGLRRLPVDQLLRDYLQLNSDVTAVIAVNLPRDLVRVAQSMGRTVPDQFSVLGFGMLEPVQGLSITMMRVSARPMGESAAHRLFEIIQRGMPEREELITIPFDLVEGDTVASPLVQSGGHTRVLAL